MTGEIFWILFLYTHKKTPGTLLSLTTHCHFSYVNKIHIHKLVFFFKWASKCMCAPLNHIYHCDAKHRNHHSKKLPAKWASNNKTQIRVSASVLVPTATSFHCLKVWHLGERKTMLYFACHFPSGTRLLLSSEVHLETPNIRPEWKCPSLTCFKQIFSTLPPSILCIRLLCIIWIYPLHRHKQPWHQGTQAAEEQRTSVTCMGTRKISMAVLQPECTSPQCKSIP